MSTRLALLSAFFLGALVFGTLINSGTVVGEEVLRAGIIGTDTSHVVAFAGLLNSDKATGVMKRIRVVAAYPGGSEDIPSSRDRVKGFADTLATQGVKIVDTIEQVVAESDVIFLESVDGRVHLEQFHRAAQGKPVFIDKPAAGSLADLLIMLRIADETKTPCFSASGLRFCPETRQVCDADIGKTLGAVASTPFNLEPHHPDLFWYGIHGVEALYAMLGTGCVSVQRSETNLGAVVNGQWADGRQGSVWALKTDQAVYARARFGDRTAAANTGFSGYQPLLEAICQFFVTAKAPVSHEEMIEVLAFMEAADESKRLGGASVSVAEIIDRARKLADKRYMEEFSK
jgi:predicted dehydrogenase